MLSSLIRSSLLNVSLTLWLTGLSTAQIEYQMVGKRAILSINIEKACHDEQTAFYNAETSEFKLITLDQFR